MADITIPAGQFAIISLIGRAQDGSDAPLQDGTVVVDLGTDYPKVYAARQSAAGVQPYIVAIVPKVQASMGGSYQVSFNINGNDASSGIALPQLVQSVEVDGPAPGPQVAKTFKFTGPVTFDVLANAPADPGTAAITL